MKALISVLLFLSVASVEAFAAPATKDVVIGLSEVYIPGGFSSTTDSYVVVSGMFPNSCYSWKGAQINSPDTFTHEVRAIATVTQQMCLMVMVPYQREVSLGMLATGSHTLRFMNGDGTFFEKTMKIE